jgi:hypothetical protein
MSDFSIKSSLRFLIVSVIVLTPIFAIAIYFKFIGLKEIAANPAISTGVVIDMFSGKQSYLKYKFCINAECYESEGAYKDQYYVGDSISIIYLKSDPNTSIPIAEYNDYARFFPISVVKKYKY